MTEFGSTFPATLIDDSSRGGLRHDVEASSEPGGSFTERDYRYGVATYTAPRIFSATTGVSISIDPIFDSGRTSFTRQRG